LLDSKKEVDEERVEHGSRTGIETREAERERNFSSMLNGKETSSIVG
jgi:hypothetical protein